MSIESYLKNATICIGFFVIPGQVIIREHNITKIFKMWPLAFCVREIRGSHLISKGWVSGFASDAWCKRYINTGEEKHNYHQAIHYLYKWSIAKNL